MQQNYYNVKLAKQSKSCFVNKKHFQKESFLHILDIFLYIGFLLCRPDLARRKHFITLNAICIGKISILNYFHITILLIVLAYYIND